MFELHLGDCLEVMKTMPDSSVDTIITDPPAGINFMNKEFDRDRGGRDQWVAWLTEIMQEALRLLKPGGMALVWSIPRTSHWTGMALEDAGFIPKDCIYHIFATGFPKSLAVDKAINKATGSESKAQEWRGYGSALKPAAEVWWIAQKPIDKSYAANALKHGVAGLWIDGGRIPTADGDYDHPGNSGIEDNTRVYGKWEHKNQIPPHANGRWPANLIIGDAETARLLDEQSGVSKSSDRPRNNSKTIGGNGKYNGGVGMVTGGHSDTGGASRFFLNLPDDEPTRMFYCAKASRRERNAGLEGMEERDEKAVESAHSTICAKCNKQRVNVSGTCQCSDPEWVRVQQKPAANHHPTVKPVALCRYLARLTRTPTGGVVLDPFMGSGSIGIGALLEGRSYIGIEMDEDYYKIAERRLQHALEQVEHSPPQLELPLDDAPKGRWPANVLLSPEVGEMLDEQSGISKSSDKPRHNGEFKSVAKGRELPHITYGHSDTGGASRFFKSIPPDDLEATGD